jgi:uncharacterized membrane protein
MNGWLIAGTTFLASAVEAVEALTIVLAVGVTQSWRASLTGAAWGFGVLVAIVVVLGPAIVTFIPLAALRLAIGVFLLLFGLAWLRKAILRYSGRKALHDEAAIYAQSIATLRGDERAGQATAFNAVLLEGLEVAVIVVTFGSSAPRGWWWSAGGALAALVLVSAVGFALRTPLSRVPENALKFTVGIMLTSFGTLWTGEGVGIAWWRDDLSLAWIIPAFLAVSGATIGLAKRGRTRVAEAAHR